MAYIFSGDSIIFDDSTLTESEKSEGVFISNLPKKMYIANKRATLRVDYLNKRVWYEYVDIDVIMPEPSELETILYETQYQTMLLEMGGMM